MRQKQAHIIIITKSVPKRFGNANSDKFTYYFLSDKAQMTFWQKHTVTKQHKPLKSLQKEKRTNINLFYNSTQHIFAVYGIKKPF